MLSAFHQLTINFLVCFYLKRSVEAHSKKDCFLLTYLKRGLEFVMKIYCMENHLIYKGNDTVHTWGTLQR